MEMDMAWHLKCFPSFNGMEFYEFLAKYEKLKNRLKENKSGAVDFFQQFKNYLGKND